MTVSQMYRPNILHWNAYEMGPKRDIVGELKAAVEAQGMTLGVSSHRIEHWFFMSNGKSLRAICRKTRTVTTSIGPPCPTRRISMPSTASPLKNL